jgi:virulence-associated protein VagC
MSKLLISIASVGLLTTAFNLGNLAKASDSTSPHVESKFEFPKHRWATVRQTIQVHVPRNSPALESLRIDVPENIDFPTSKVEITDGDRVIDAPISRQGQRLQIGFSRSISPDTHLRINFNGVQRNMRTQLSVYYVYGRTVDGVNSFLGEAYFPH